WRLKEKIKYLIEHPGTVELEDARAPFRAILEKLWALSGPQSITEILQCLPDKGLPKDGYLSPYKCQAESPWHFVVVSHGDVAVDGLCLLTFYPSLRLVEALMDFCIEHKT